MIRYFSLKKSVYTKSLKGWRGTWCWESLGEWNVRTVTTLTREENKFGELGSLQNTHCKISSLGLLTWICFCYCWFHLHFWHEPIVRPVLLAQEASIFDPSAVVCVAVICIPKGNSVNLVSPLSPAVSSNLVCMDWIVENCLMGRASDVSEPSIQSAPLLMCQCVLLNSVRNKMFSCLCLWLPIGSWSEKKFGTWLSNIVNFRKWVF